MDGSQVILQQPSMNWYLTPKSRRVMWNSFSDSRTAAAAVATKAAATASAANAKGQAKSNPGPARNTAYEQMCKLLHATPGTRTTDPLPPRDPRKDWCDTLTLFQTATATR